MTAADQPTPRVGGTITTAEQLDALPVGVVIRPVGKFAAEKVLPEGQRFPKWFFCGQFGPHLIRDIDLPAVLLYRPDAPHPDPKSVRPGHDESNRTTLTDAAVEQAARAVMAEAGCEVQSANSTCVHSEDSCPCSPDFAYCSEHDEELQDVASTICPWAVRVARVALRAGGDA